MCAYACGYVTVTKRNESEKDQSMGGVGGTKEKGGNDVAIF